jgi:hypothetical protein
MRKAKANNRILAGLSLVAMIGLAVSCSKNGSTNNTPSGPKPADATHIYVQDSAFKAYLQANVCPDAFDADGRLDVNNAEVTGFTGKMQFDSTSKIQSLKGIAYFTKMSKLILQSTMVDSLDLSSAMAVDTIRLMDNLDLQYVNVNGCNSMRYIRFSNIPVRSMDLSNLAALNTISGISCARLNSLKVDNDGNLQHILCSGLSAVATINTSTCPNLQRLYMEYGSALTSLNLKNNSNLKGLLVTYASSFKTVDLSGNPLLAVVGFDDSGVDSIDYSHNPQLFSIAMPFTPVRNLNLQGNPKVCILALDGCNYLKTLDLRAQTHADFWYASYAVVSKNYTISRADLYELYPDGFFGAPVQTAVCNQHGVATRKINGDPGDLFGGIRVPQYLDVSGLSLTNIKVNDAIKNNYSFVMARRTAGLVPPPVVTVYAADQTTVLCNDYDPLNEVCNQ